MSVELRPLGVSCNIQCQYCYQNPQRDAGNLLLSYDLQKMKDAIMAEGGPFTLFGGEPLLVPEKDLEELWSWGLGHFCSNAIQTNGTLINDEHIRMFKRYKVHVGVSLDGPGQLNDARWHGTLEKTRQATAKAEYAIERLCREGIPPSLIITVHRNNGTRDKLPILYDWIRYLEGIGVRWVRLHLLESESAAVRAKYALTIGENIEALMGCAALQKTLAHLKFDLFADMRLMLMGHDESTTCIWNSCDPYTTRAVRGVEGNGQRSNCGRTNKDGIDFVKAEVPGFERYLALYATPQEVGGCKGCRFFLMCRGQCPGTAIDGDWRNRTEHCEVWKTLYALLEEELTAEGQEPLSLSPSRKQVEKALLEAWSHGQNTSMAQVLGDQRTQQSGLSFDWRAEIKKLEQEVQEFVGNGSVSPSR
jgi:radical SAM protein with 4Fe4S-binding SPASM domain